MRVLQGARPVLHLHQTLASPILHPPVLPGQQRDGHNVGRHGNHHNLGVSWQGGPGAVMGSLNQRHRNGELGNLQQAAEQLPWEQRKAYVGRLLPAALYAQK